MFSSKLIVVAALLLGSLPAFAGQVLRGFVVGKGLEDTYFAIETTNLEEPQVLRLQGVDAETIKRVSEMPLDKHYEIRVAKVHFGSEGDDVADVTGLEPLTEKFPQTTLRDPDPGVGSTVPQLVFTDPLLPRRAHMYEYFLNSKVWVFNFLQWGGSPEKIVTMRKTVIANIILSEFPKYPHLRHQLNFRDVLETAGELWANGDRKMLNSIRAAIEERLDVVLGPDSKSEKVLNRKGVSAPCEQILENLRGFRGEEHNQLLKLRARFMEALQNMTNPPKVDASVGGWKP